MDLAKPNTNTVILGHDNTLPFPRFVDFPPLPPPTFDSPEDQKRYVEGVEFASTHTAMRYQSRVPVNAGSTSVRIPLLGHAVIEVRLSGLERRKLPLIALEYNGVYVTPFMREIKTTTRTPLVIQLVDRPVNILFEDPFPEGAELHITYISYRDFHKHFKDGVLYIWEMNPIVISEGTLFPRYSP